MVQVAAGMMLAAAKINLRLTVTGVRDDGFHLLDGESTFIALFDELFFCAREDGKLTGGFLPDKNLSDKESSDNFLSAQKTATETVTDSVHGLSDKESSDRNSSAKNLSAQKTATDSAHGSSDNFLSDKESSNRLSGGDKMSDKESSIHLSAADSDGGDLCLRAAKLLQAAGNVGRGAAIKLKKNIPVGGGLGGGSSDAAATLIALNQLWELNFPLSELMKIGAATGADVPFFLFGRSAKVGGVGDKLIAVDVAPRFYLLVFSPVVASTGAVYAEYRKCGKGGGKTANDLTAAAMNLYPQIAETAAICRQTVGEATMSGGGGVFFLPFCSRAAATAGGRLLPPSIKFAVARGLQNHPPRRLV